MLWRIAVFTGCTMRDILDAAVPRRWTQNASPAVIHRLARLNFSRWPVVTFSSTTFLPLRLRLVASAAARDRGADEIAEPAMARNSSHNAVAINQSSPFALSVSIIFICGDFLFATECGPNPCDTTPVLHPKPRVGSLCHMDSSLFFLARSRSLPYWSVNNKMLPFCIAEKKPVFAVWRDGSNKNALHMNSHLRAVDEINGSNGLRPDLRASSRYPAMSCQLSTPHTRGPHAD